MQNVIVACAQGLLQTIKAAATELQIAENRIIRSWYPVLEVENLQSTDSPLIIVYVQDADSETGEIQIGCKKTISLTVGLAAKISEVSLAEIDPIVNQFEKLQNVISSIESFENEDRRFIITKRETATLNDPEQIESLIVISRMNLEIEVYTN